MFFDRVPKTSRTVKYAILAIALVTVVVLFLNSGVSYSFGRDERCNSEIFSEDLERLLEAFMEGEQSKLKIGLNSLTDEENSTLKLLVEYPPACLQKYHGQTTSSASVSQLEAIALQNKISPLYMMYSFNGIMASLNIKAVVIEPSVIYCMLEAKYKDLLAKRNFTIADFTNSNGIITYAIFADDVVRLKEEENIRKFRNIGFQPYFLENSPAEWMLQNDTGFDFKKYTSHVFYSYYDWTIHVVVFQKRSNYLWHSALNANDTFNIPDKRDLLFMNYDSSYENFTLIHLGNKWPKLTNFYIPSSPHYFLFQIPSSRFLECDLTRAVEVLSATDTEKPSDSSQEKFKSRTLTSLHELKTFFNPLLMHFWIFSGTMLGWYRQCDIIPYTSDVDFGAWASEIDDLDYIIKHFTQNKKLKILERMGMLEEALEFQLRLDGLRVDVFFMYRINNGSWASGHRPSKGYYFRYYYPHFNLCSAELLKEKVQVPCETEDVIVTEYGPNWMKPVSSWYYESSIHNRGPNIYWDKKRRPKAFQEY